MSAPHHIRSLDTTGPGLQILAQAAARGPQLYELGEVLGQALLSAALDEGADDAVHGRDERQRVLNRQLRLASLG